VDNANLTFKSLSNSLKELEANCGPLSEIILSGNPNRLINCFVDFSESISLMM